MIKKGFLLFLCLLYGALLGCASSSISRSAASEVDAAYQNSSSLITGAGDVNPTDALQNSSQTTRGVMVGGVAGAVAGSITSGAVGFFSGAAGGAVLGGILGAYIDHHATLIDQLENRGVKVFVLGDQVMLVLPSAWIFTAMTPNIRPQAYATLDLIAQLIRGFTTMSVKIAAYTNDAGDRRVNCIVSQQQAEAIQKYLWPRVNTRVLTAGGYGGTNLVGKNHLVWGDGPNYRIEITLEKLPV